MYSRAILTSSPKYQIGECVFVCFALEDTGRLYKLSQPLDDLSY